MDPTSVPHKSSPPNPPKTQRDGTQVYPVPTNCNAAIPTAAAAGHQDSPDTPSTHKRKRLKIAVACNGCRDKKLKCDGKRPACSTCERKGITADCEYDEGRSKNQFSQEYVANLNKRIEDLEALLRSQNPMNGVVTRDEPALAKQTTGSVQPQNGAMNSPIELPQKERQSPEDCFPLPVSNANSGYPLSFVRNEPAISTSPLPLGVSSSLPPQASIPHEGHTSPNLGHDPESPPTEEIDAMGAIIHATDDTCQNSSSTTARDLTEKDGFYGGSSVASFMKEIRSSSSGRRPTLRKHCSPTITDNTRKSPQLITSSVGSQDAASIRRVLPLSLVPNTLVEMFILPPRALADHLINCYWENVHSMYPFFHPPSFMQKYEALWSPRNNSGIHMEVDPQLGIFYGCVNVMFALGCKFSPSMTLEEREANAEVFMDRSKPLIQIEIIDTGSLELVQMMMLMGQVMQSTTAANRCWNAFGMAIRISQGLGMHLEGNIARDPDPVRREMKRRIWHGCVIFDRILAMTLGRPCVIRKNHVLLPEPSEISSPSPATTGRPAEYTYYILHIKLYSILGDILFKVYEPLTDDAGLIAIGPNIAKIFKDTQCSNSIVELDATLLEFWNNVPKEFLPETDHPSPVIKRQAVILRANYLHLRIFLFRPLLSILTTKPAMVKESNMMHSFIFLRGSTYCIHAALELIELIYTNYSSGHVPAWWYNVLYIYTAAAVLIAANHRFHHFITEITSEQICAAVGKAKEILQMLQSVSRAARTCLAILDGFDQNQATTQSQNGASVDHSDTREQQLHQHHDTGVGGSENTAKEQELRPEEERLDEAPLPPPPHPQMGVAAPAGIQLDRFENVQEGMAMYTWPLDAGAGSQEFLLPSFEWLMASGDMDAEAGMGVW